MLPHWVNNYKYLGYFPRKRFLKDLSKQFTDPMWTVQQIAKSKLLITSTFHGVMMALMTKTPFIAVMNPNLLARLESPIAEVFSEKRLVTLDELMKLNSEDVLEFIKDDDLNHERLNQYIHSSENWLRSVLTEEGGV
jgi:hypothetical protein